MKNLRLLTFSTLLINTDNLKSQNLESNFDDNATAV